MTFSTPTLFAFAIAALLGGSLSARAVTLDPGDLIGVRFGNQVVAIDPSGTISPVPSHFYGAASAAVTHDGRLYVADTGDGFDGSLYEPPGVYQIDPATGQRSLVSQTPPRFLSTNLAADPSGAVYAGNYGTSLTGSLLDGSVRRISSTGAVTTVAPDWNIVLGVAGPPINHVTYLAQRWSPLEIAVSDAGDLFVLAQLEIVGPFGSVFTQGLMRRDAATGAFSLVRHDTPYVSPIAYHLGQSMVFGPDGMLYLSASQPSSASLPGVYRIDPLTGATTFWLPGLTGELARDGSRLLLGTLAGIFAFDPATAAASTVFLAPNYGGFVSLTAVPEPSSAALVLAGIVALAARRPSRRSSS